jgi:hypothetical protein
MRCDQERERMILLYRFVSRLISRTLTKAELLKDA